MAQSDDDFTPRRYQVRHKTTYRYDDAVEAAYERGFLRHRDTPQQRVVENTITISPDADVVADHLDHFGNHSFYVEVRSPHTELVVESVGLIDVDWPRPDLLALNGWTVASAAAAVAGDAGIDPVERATFLLPSPLIDLAPSVARYAEGPLGADRPLGEALAALVHAIYTDFKYQPGSTSVRTTLPELLRQRRGVCQDFAHLAVGCLRSAGIPARYVSGHIETTPPAGRPRLEGSDASHAWASALTPLGWVDLDPTNDHFADSRYLTRAWGRDFRDVSPLKGVVFTEAKKSTLKVGVDVLRMPSA